jgi:hypothetical protein
MFAEFSEFWYVMFFYAILASLIMPLIGYYFKGISGLGQGYVFGSVLSLIFILAYALVNIAGSIIFIFTI